MSDFVISAVPPLTPGDEYVQNATITGSINISGRASNNTMSTPAVAPFLTTGPDTLMGFWLPTGASLSTSLRMAIAQPTATVSTTSLLIGGSTGASAVLTAATTFGVSGGNEYTLPQVIAALEALGLLAQ